MSFDEMAERVLDSCMDTFQVGGGAIYLPKTGSSFSFRGVFDRASYSVDPNTHALVQSFQPKLGIKLSDLPQAPRKEDRVIVKEVTYRIIEVEKDGQGGATLHLQKVS